MALTLTANAAPVKDLRPTDLYVEVPRRASSMQDKLSVPHGNRDAPTEIRGARRKSVTPNENP